LREEAYLSPALTDLKCEILNTKKIRTLLGRSYDVDLAVKTPFGIVGFVKNKSGEFSLVGDDMVLAKKSRFMNDLSQRYAYRKILDEAKQAGFQLVHEQTNEQNAVRLVLRKWS
jgi:hypothetical protein